MMKSINDLERSTMRRIYGIWFVRTVASPAVVKALIASALLWRLKEYVSLRNVIANAPSLANVGSAFVFFENAFFHTQLAVQAMILALLVVGVWFMRDMIRGYALLAFRQMA